MNTESQPGDARNSHLRCRKGFTFRIGAFSTLFLIFILFGCAPAEPRPDASSLAEEIHEVFSPDNQSSASPAGGVVARRDYWSIALATLTRENHQQEAANMQNQLSTQFGLRDTFVETTETSSVLCYGKYRSATDPQLKADLERIKSLQVNKSTPFARAFAIPPDVGVSATGNPAYDLSRVRSRYGRDTPLYTLEIGIYEDKDRQVARKAAEEAAALYRSRGEQAFYYHGPHRSSVTIGLFTADQVDFNAPGFGAFVRELKQRYPYRAINGRKAKVKEWGRDAGFVPSQLMAVP
ncbi:MAG TPA: hypothetical protein ENJ06_03760 [Phycisphaeraceae bacterium]|nr:hypothetical protein [Phycisphaeraceae bacterium]